MIELNLFLGNPNHIFIYKKKVLALEVYCNEGQGIPRWKYDSAKVLPNQSTNCGKY